MACLAMPSACWSAGVDLQPPRVRLVFTMKPAENENSFSFLSILDVCVRKEEVSSTSARRIPSPHRTAGHLSILQIEGRVLLPDEGG